MGIDVRGEGPEANSYEQDVRAVLQEVRETRAGALLLQALASKCRGKRLLISNRQAVQEEEKACKPSTAMASALDRSKATRPGAGIWGHSYDDEKGRGGGANAVMDFVPGAWAAAGVCRTKYHVAGPNIWPDIVLFHELVHALRVLSGSEEWHEVEVDGGPSMGWEEFVAILLTNIYMADRKEFVGLRAFNHLVLAELPRPGEFLRRCDNRQKVLDLWADETMRPLLDQLAGLNCKFNPLRDRNGAAGR
jgi:hypothetical protein